MNIGYIFTHKMLCQTHDLCSEVIQYTSNTYKVSNRDKSLLLWFLNFKILPFKIKALPTLIVKHGHNNIKWTFCLMLIFQYNGIQESEELFSPKLSLLIWLHCSVALDDLQRLCHFYRFLWFVIFSNCMWSILL